MVDPPVIWFVVVVVGGWWFFTAGAVICRPVWLKHNAAIRHLSTGKVGVSQSLGGLHSLRRVDLAILHNGIIRTQGV